MYHPNQSPSARRAGEDFLRRMAQADSPCPMQSAPVFQQDSAPSCCNPPQHDGCSTPKNPQMPSLAMVYAPVQSWSCLMDSPEMALAHGTLFKELFLPFEGGCSRRSTRTTGRC